MTKRSFVFAGAGLAGMALALFASAASAEDGRWKIVQSDGSYAWRLDTMTGALDQCDGAGKCIGAAGLTSQGSWQAQVSENKRDIWLIDAASGAMRRCSPVDASGGRVMDPSMAASYKCTDMAGPK